MRPRPTSPWLSVATSATLLASPAAAQGQGRVAFDISAGPLDRSLATVARIAGVSIGSVERLSGTPAPALKGRMTVAVALARLTAGTPFAAQKVSSTAYRIVRRPRRVPPVARATPTRQAPRPEAPRRALPARSVPAPDLEAIGPEIIVTGTKRPQASDDVPLSLTIVDPSDLLQALAAPGTAAVAFELPQLTLADIGPGQNRLFLRGVADSPFNGPSQSTVTVQIDETRATYDAPDPNLALVDMRSVEILAGPQGPLYGTGALGGVMRLVTNKPALDRVDGVASVSGTVLDGKASAGASAVLNAPLLSDRLSARLVAYREGQPGWIDSGSRRNSNRSLVSGFRGALRGRIDRWLFDVSGVDQSIDVRDTQYTFTGASLVRAAQPPESSDNDFRSLSGVASGPVGRLHLTAVAGVVRHAIGSRLALMPSTESPLFDDERRFELDTQEVRLTGARWLAGISLLRGQTRRRAGVAGDPLAGPAIATDQSTREVALFGEGTLPLSSRWTLTGGARLYRTAIDDELLDDELGDSRRRRKTGISPSLALSWRPDGGGVVYARAAHALRPGALSAATSPGLAPIEDDSVRVIEAGARLPLAQGLDVSGSVSWTDWRNVQSDMLASNGLVATNNVGNAHIPSLSLSADWRRTHWFASGSLLLQRPRLERASTGSEIDDLRLPVVPDLAASIRSGVRGSAWKAGIEGRITGGSRLSFDPRLDREIGEFEEIALFGSADAGRWTVSGRLDNLFDSRADRLGYGNSFTLLNRPQFVPQEPRRLSVSLTYRWIGQQPQEE